MAKKKKDEEVTTTQVLSRAVPLDSMMQEAAKFVTSKKGMEKVFTGTEIIHAVSVPSLSIRYMLQNEGLLLGRGYELVGEPGSYKSTTATEFLRWCRLNGGCGALVETEHKENPELRLSVMHGDTNACVVYTCGTTEEWHTTVTRSYSFYADAMATHPELTYPYLVIVDSVGGNLADKVSYDIRNTGHASKRFATEAGLNTDFFKEVPKMIAAKPFVFLAVNHLKVGHDDNGNVVEKIPGGKALDYHLSTIYVISKVGAIQEFSNGRKKALLRISPYKNTYGPKDVTVEVAFWTWWEKDESEVDRLHSEFDWYSATTHLLGEAAGIPKENKNKFLTKVGKIVGIESRMGGSAGKLWYSTDLKVPSSEAMSSRDFGKHIESFPALLAELYPMLGIQRRPFFRTGIEYVRQLEDYAYMAMQSDAAKDYHAKQIAGLGSMTRSIQDAESD